MDSLNSDIFHNPFIMNSDDNDLLFSSDDKFQNDEIFSQKTFYNKDNSSFSSLIVDFCSSPPSKSFHPFSPYSSSFDAFQQPSDLCLDSLHSSNPNPSPSPNNKKKRKVESIYSNSNKTDIKEKKRIVRLERNRISAQVSRDRKKLYLNQLEQQVGHLTKKNQELADENDRLKQQLQEVEQKKSSFIPSRLSSPITIFSLFLFVIFCFTIPSFNDISTLTPSPSLDTHRYSINLPPSRVLTSINEDPTPPLKINNNNSLTLYQNSNIINKEEILFQYKKAFWQWYNNSNIFPQINDYLLFCPNALRLQPFLNSKSNDSLPASSLYLWLPTAVTQGSSGSVSDSERVNPHISFISCPIKEYYDII